MYNKTIYKLDHNILSENNIERFKYTKTEANLIDDLKSIMNTTKGVYVLGGFRGVGKSSVLERALYEMKMNRFEKKDQLILKFEIPIQIERFYIEILIRLSKSLSKNHNANTCLIDRFNKIRIMMEGEIKETNEYSHENYQLQEKESNLEAGVSPKKWFAYIQGSKLKKNKTGSNNSNKENCTNTFVYSDEQKRNDFFRLMNEISLEYEIIIVIDELDKLPANKIGEFLEKYKLLLLTTNTLTVLICDKADALYLEDNYNDYVNDFIYYNSLNLEEFTERVNTLELGSSLNTCKHLYYYTLGNQRELVKGYYRSKANEDIDFKSGLLCCFENTYFFKYTTQKYQDIIKVFFKEFIEYFALFEYLHFEEVVKIKDNFLNTKYPGNYKVSLLLDRVLKYIKGNFNFITESIDYISIFGKNFMPQIEVVKSYFSEMIEKGLMIYDSETDSLIKDKFKVFLSFESSKRIECQNSLSKINWDHALLEYYEMKIILHKFIPECFYANRKPIVIKNIPSHDKMEVAIDKLKQHSTDLVGFIYFEPYDPNGDSNYKPLYNGYIVTEGRDDIIAISFTDYPGLSSHKKVKIHELFNYIKDNKIKAIKICNDASMLKHWELYFAHHEGSEKTIDEYVQKHFIDEWVELLKNLSQYDELIPGYENVEQIK